jgi:hypothetical protein
LSWQHKSPLELKQPSNIQLKSIWNLLKTFLQ